MLELYAWHWLVLAMLLGGGEMLFSGAHCLWIGTAALLTALLTYFLGINAVSQVIIFSILGIGLVILSRKLFPKEREVRGDAYLNRRGDKLIGQVLVLTQPIVNGRGQVKIGDSMWTVQGDPMEAGGKVKVVAIDGTLLFVEKY